MIVNEDHFVNNVFHQPGEYALRVVSMNLAMSWLGFEYWSTPPIPQTWPLSGRFRGASK